MHCFALPGRSCENCPKIAEKSQATSQKTVGLFNYTGFLVLMAPLKSRINDLFVYSGHFVISKEKDNFAYSFLHNKMS